MSSDAPSSGDRRSNGWNEYSKLVLKELETLADGIDALRGELLDVKQELAKMQVREDRVQELRDWKHRVDDIASPAQLAAVVRDVEELKQFKTKAVTVFAMVQFGMAVLGLIIKFVI
jgi:hypothetical protein